MDLVTTCARRSAIASRQFFVGTRGKTGRGGGSIRVQGDDILSEGKMDDPIRGGQIASEEGGEQKQFEKIYVLRRDRMNVCFVKVITEKKRDKNFSNEGAKKGHRWVRLARWTGET